jgi:hypothetical protein
MIKIKVQKKTNNTSFENTENLKLSIQFSLDGFSFCISDIHDTMLYFSDYQFDKTQTTPKDLLLKIQEIF